MKKLNRDNIGSKTVFQCIECGELFPLDMIIYRCKRCDGLLSVKHEIEELKSRGADFWKRKFDSRSVTTPHPYNSGVWSKKEWVLPNIDNGNIMSLGEGFTPLVHMRNLARELNVTDIAIKQCGVSHTGSFKDLGMTVLISHVESLREKGLPIRCVVCASTGDTSASLAAYAAAARIPAVVLLPAGKISRAQLVQPLASGAIVISLETDFDGCMRIVKEITKDQSFYLANSMNPLRIEGQKTISIEICQQMGWEVPDWVIVPGGNLGNVSAIGEGFRLLYEIGIIQKRPRICVAQSHNANPLFQSFEKNFATFEPIQAKSTLASAIQIGNPVSYRRAINTLKSFDGVVEEASEAELTEAAARVDKHGFFNCPHTGVALVAMFKLIESGRISSSDRVVVISTAHGLKFSKFKSGYHAGTLERVENEKSQYRNDFISLPDDIEKIKKVLNDKLK